MKKNRLQNNLFFSVNVKKKANGYYEHPVCDNNKIMAVQWNDNSIVTTCSNSVGLQCVRKAKKGFFSERKKPYMFISAT